MDNLRQIQLLKETLDFLDKLYTHPYLASSLHVAFKSDGQEKDGIRLKHDIEAYLHESVSKNNE